MKKFKNLSNEFVLSVGLLLTSFFIFQAAILPTIIPEGDLTAATVRSTKDTFKIERSKINPEAYVFDFKFDPRSVAPKKGDKFFDAAIVPFDIKWIPNFEPSNITDAWGYPVRENAFMAGAKPTERKKASLNPFKSNLALAYDEDPDVLGLVNCRENESVTGYFKAYFEDVALGNGLGYADATYGQGRREEVCQVLQDIAELIRLDETDVTPDIIFAADTGDLPFGVLAGASAYFGYYTTYLDNGSLHKHIISRDDPTPEPGFFDAYVITGFNGVAWDVDSDLNPGTYDFYTVIYHEVMHALGFRGLLPSVIASSGEISRYDTFNQYSFRDYSLANQFIDTVSQQLNVPNGAPSPWFITDQVVYSGTQNLIGAMPDGVRPVYSPGGWQQGSSLSHFDMDRASGEIYVMHPSIGTNTERAIHEGEREVLCHLGYRVEGMFDCASPTPFAEDDLYNLSFPSFCIMPLSNDNAFSGLAKIYDLQEIVTNQDDAIAFYATSNCTGDTVSLADGPRSFKFYPTGGPDSRMFEYRIKNANDKISFPARIRVNAACSNPEGEHVCNGDFETDGYYNDNLLSLSCMNGWFNPATPFWCHFVGSPDMAWQESPANQIDLPWSCNFFTGCVVELMDGSTKAAFTFRMRDTYNDEGDPEFVEAIFTKLEDPLEEGSVYRVSMDALFVGNVSSPEAKVIAGLTNDSTMATMFFPGSTLANMPDFQQQILDEHVPSNLLEDGWIHVEQDFVADDNYQYLAISPDFLTQADCLSCRYYGYFDNISIRKVETSNSISGTVYHDQTGNGSLDFVDSKLSGITVGIFHEGETEPFDITSSLELPNLGEYSFSGLADGTYYVALADESIFPNLTDPDTNSLIPGYSHAHEVVVSDGQSSVGRNFGVVLEGEYPNIPSTNLHLKKGLIDSTLSVFDRNITWSVEVTNYGSEVAHNINILDIPPTPLIYYGHITSPPNTYISGTGVWHIPQLNIGQTAYIQITMKVPSGTCGTKINTATLQFFDEADTDPSDNIATSQIKLRNCGNVLQTVK